MIDPETPEHEEVEELAVVPEVIPGAAAAVPARPVTGRKSLGVKEPIVFKWKLIGRSNGLFVTLFKSTEREEAEAQLARLTSEGYYSDVRILEADAKVVQPVSPKDTRKPAKSPAPVAKTPERVAAKKPAKSRAEVAKPAPVKRTVTKIAPKASVRTTKSKPSKPSPKKTARSK